MGPFFNSNPPRVSSFGSTAQPFRSAGLDRCWSKTEDAFEKKAQAIHRAPIVSRFYKHHCVIFATALKRGIIIPSSQRRERQLNQRRQKAEPLACVPTEILTHTRVHYQDPSAFSQDAKAASSCGEGATPPWTQTWCASAPPRKSIP